MYFALFLIKTLNIDRAESTSCSYKNKRDFFKNNIFFLLTRKNTGAKIHKLSQKTRQQNGGKNKDD